MSPLITNRPQNDTMEARIISELRFDYLPDSPLKNNWTLCYGDPEKVHFTLATNAPEKGSLSAHTSIDYSIEYEIPKEIGELSDGLRLSIRFKGENDTMFWTEVEMANVDGSKWEKRWIKHYKGNKPSRQVDKPYDDEWERWMSGIELTNGWSDFLISLKDAVKETWGNDGWVFKGLTKISIRGNISISPIKILKFTPPENSEPKPALNSNSSLRPPAITPRSPEISNRTERFILANEDVPLGQSAHRHLYVVLAFTFGVVFLGAILILSVIIPEPTPTQFIIFRTVLALAAAGIAAVVPGTLAVKLNNWLRAGGALAIFVVVYFYSPATLAIKRPPTQNPHEQRPSLPKKDITEYFPQMFLDRFTASFSGIKRGGDNYDVVAKIDYLGTENDSIKIVILCEDTKTSSDNAGSATRTTVETYLIPFSSIPNIKIQARNEFADSLAESREQILDLKYCEENPSASSGGVCSFYSESDSFPVSVEQTTTDSSLFMSNGSFNDAHNYFSIPYSSNRDIDDFLQKISEFTSQ